MQYNVWLFNTPKQNKSFLVEETSWGAERLITHVKAISSKCAEYYLNKCIPKWWFQSFNVKQ